MAEMGTEPDPESKIRRLTSFGSGFLVFGAGSGFGVSFSDSAHLWFAVVPQAFFLLLLQVKFV